MDGGLTFKEAKKNTDTQSLIVKKVIFGLQDVGYNFKRYSLAKGHLYCMPFLSLFLSNTTRFDFPASLSFCNVLRTPPTLSLSLYFSLSVSLCKRQLDRIIDVKTGLVASLMKLEQTALLAGHLNLSVDYYFRHPT